MTEKRYTDGTLAKWYYSQTDVISDGDNEYYLKSKEPIRNWDYSELLGTNELLDELNKISDENEQLKQFKEQNIQEYLKLKKVCNNTKKENEELKNKIDTLKGLLIDTGLM